MTGGRAAADVDLRSSEPVALTTFRRALDAEAAADRRRCPGRGVGNRPRLRLAVARAIGRTRRAAPPPRAGVPHVPGVVVSFSLNKLYLARAVERPTEELRRIVNASPDQRRRDRRGRVRRSSSRRCPGCGSSRCWCSSRCCSSSSGRSPGGSSPSMRRDGQICRPILIVGTDADAVGLLHAAQRTPHLGYRVVGFVGPDDIGVRGGATCSAGSSRPRRCSRRPAPPAC